MTQKKFENKLEWCKMIKNVTKWYKMKQNDAKWCKMIQNGVPNKAPPGLPSSEFWVPSFEFRGGDRSEGGDIRVPKWQKRKTDQRVATSEFRG